MTLDSHVESAVVLVCMTVHCSWYKYYLQQSSKFIFQGVQVMCIKTAQKNDEVKSKLKRR